MEWLQNEKLLSDIIAKINDARTKSHVERCDRYFEAINSLYSAYYQYRKRNNKLTNEEERQRKRPGDKRSFEELIKQGIDQEVSTPM